MAKVFLETFGCQMNALDSELILSALAVGGYMPTDRKEDAEVMKVEDRGETEVAR